MKKSVDIEEKNKRSGMRTSIIIHLGILFLAFYILLPNDPDKNIDTQYQVAVEIDFRESSLSKYAHADAGAKRKKSEKPKAIEAAPKKEIKVDKPKVDLPKPKPDIKPTPPVEQVVSETVQEESEIEAIEEEIEEALPELEEIPEPEPEPVIEPEPEPIPEPEPDPVPVEEPADEAPSQTSVEGADGTGDTSESEGDSDTAPSILDGHADGTGKANSGDGDGSTSGDDGDEGLGDGGAGTGLYDGSGDGIFGRRVIKRNNKELYGKNMKTGRITFKICINRAGLVTYLELLEDETTTRDKELLKSAANAFRKYEYEPKRNGPKEECGKISFNLDLTGINKFK